MSRSSPRGAAIAATVARVIPRPILHIVTQLELGGAQRSTLQLLARLDRRRFRPILISSDGPLTEDARRIDGLDVHLWPTLQRTPHPVHDLVTLCRLRSFLQAWGVTLVHTHSSKAGILGRWAAHAAGGSAIVHTIHGFGFHAGQPALLGRFYQALERITARVTDRLIVVSEHDRQTGLRAGIGRPEQYRLIRYGLDPDPGADRGTREEVRRALGIPSEAPVMGTVACFKPQKAPLDFVRTCHLVRQQVPAAHFLWAGDGMLRAQVEAMRRHLGLDDALHLLGWRRDIQTLLAAMDVFVLTSRWEGLPMACLEAQAAGLPVVATSAGGLPELVPSTAQGFLVPVGAPEAAAKAVVRLLQDDASRQRIGARNREVLAGWGSVDAMVRQIEELYEELLAAREGAR